MKREGKKVMMVAGDTFRAGAIEQLELWANKVGCTIVKSESKDPSAVMYDALNIAKKENYDVVLIDTAGRLHIDDTLMQELKDIASNFKIDEKILVIDGSMGQDAINVITGFNEALDLTGCILTKLDGNTKGGVALSVRHLTHIPIKFVGTSEKMDGLSEFYPERMAERILDMGDILEIVNKVEDVIDEDEAKKQAIKLSLIHI